MSPEEVKLFDVLVPAHYLSYDEAVCLAEKIKTTARDFFCLDLGFFGIEDSVDGAVIVFFKQPDEVADNFSSILKTIPSKFHPTPQKRSFTKASDEASLSIQ